MPVCSRLGSLLDALVRLVAPSPGQSAPSSGPVNAADGKTQGNVRPQGKDSDSKRRRVRNKQRQQTDGAAEPVPDESDEDYDECMDDENPDLGITAGAVAATPVEQSISPQVCEKVLGLVGELSALLPPGAGVVSCADAVTQADALGKKDLRGSALAAAKDVAETSRK